MDKLSYAYYRQDVESRVQKTLYLTVPAPWGRGSRKIQDRIRIPGLVLAFCRSASARLDQHPAVSVIGHREACSSHQYSPKPKGDEDAQLKFGDQHEILPHPSLRNPTTTLSVQVSNFLDYIS